MFNPRKVLFVYHKILGNSACPKAIYSDLLWGAKSWQLCIPPFSGGHCITWQPCWDRSPLQKERLGQHPLRKNTYIRCHGFQSFTLKLTSPWSCANRDKLCCYCESLILTNTWLTIALQNLFFVFQFFCLWKIKLLCKSLPKGCPFASVALGHCEPVHVCRHFQAIFHMISHSVSVNV